MPRAPRRTRKFLNGMVLRMNAPLLAATTFLAHAVIRFIMVLAIAQYVERGIHGGKEPPRG